MKKLIFIFVLLCFGAQAQRTLNVPLEFPAIQDAINYAVNGDIVLVDTGTYYEQVNFLGKAITVTSKFYETGNPEYIENTIISGETLTGDSCSVVMFISGEDTTSVINGFTIRDGKGTRNGIFLNGGGIIIIHSGAKIINNRITHNILSGVAPTSLVAGGAGIATPYEADSNWVVMENNTLDSNRCIANYYDAAGGAILICSNVRLINNDILYNEAITTGYGSSYSAVFLKSLYDVPNNRVIVENNSISFNSVISENVVRGGGLICALVHSIIKNNTISDNKAISALSSNSGGAGIFIEYPLSTLIQGNTISNNQATRWGGGVNFAGADSSHTVINNNYFFNNQAQNGGALYIARIDSYIANNVFKGNIALDNGGALYLSGVTYIPIISRVINNSFTQNVSDDGGHAIASRYMHTYILNSIFWNDTTTPNELYFVNNPGYIAYCNVDTSRIVGPYIAGDMIIKADPVFCDSTTLEISFSESPCKNTGTASYTFPDDITLTAPADDIRYWPRPLDGGYDMGAWEASGVGVKERSAGLDFQVYPNPAASQVTLSYSLTIASTVFVELYDISGRLIKSSTAQLQAAGQHQETISVSSMPKGVYSVRLLVNDLSGVRKVVVVR